MNFAVLEPPAKVFSTKFGCAVPTYVRFSIPQIFLSEMATLTDLRVFYLKSFLLYGTCAVLSVFTIIFSRIYRKCANFIGADETQVY